MQTDGDEDDDQDSEEVGLVVQDGNGLVRGADLGEPTELSAHFVGWVEYTLEVLFKVEVM